MGFKREVREFMQLMKKYLLERSLEDRRIRSLEKIIDRQEKQIQQLHDRLLAKDLPQYKEYTLPETEGTSNSDGYHPEYDEELAGSVIDDENESEFRIHSGGE